MKKSPIICLGVFSFHFLLELTYFSVKTIKSKQDPGGSRVWIVILHQSQLFAVHAVLPELVGEVTLQV